MSKLDPYTAAAAVLFNKYADAEVLFLAGSVLRGEGTETSDLDLVVVYKTLPEAYRESFSYGGWPIETFVHDPQTLRYFFHQVDRTGGVPSLASMVAEGRELPQVTPFSAAIKQAAQALLDSGPPRWGETEISNSRYLITDVVDDIRAPRSRAELTASATRLYPLLAEHFLRSRQQWSARGKSIPRRLASVSPDYATEFAEAFRQAFELGETTALIELADETLRPQGGWLFEGRVQRAPQHWRME